VSPPADVYRNASYALLIAVVATLFFLASLVNALASDGTWPSVVMVGLLSLFCLTRLARAGIYAGDDGIKVVNPLRTVRVPWGHILRFTLKPRRGFPAVAFVELIDGREIQVWGIQSRSGTVPAKRIPQVEVDKLNERLAAVRAAESSAG
jgi:hypothetical protein